MVLKILAIAALVLRRAAVRSGGRPHAARSQSGVDFDCRRDRRGDDAGHVLLRRLADGELRCRRDARSAARPRARAAARRGGRRSCSTPPSPSSACMRSGRPALPSPRRRRATSCGSLSGGRGATFIALGIAISALGFLSQGMLTAPRVYFAMAEDGLFFRSVAGSAQRTRVPVVAIVLQGVAAAVIAMSGTYGQILSYVVSVDFIFFGLTGAALFVFRRRDPARASVSRCRATRYDRLLRPRLLDGGGRTTATGRWRMKRLNSPRPTSASAVAAPPAGRSGRWRADGGFYESAKPQVPAAFAPAARQPAPAPTRQNCRRRCAT